MADYGPTGRLDVLLANAAREVTWPATPDLRAAVIAGLDVPEPRVAPYRRPALLAAGALALLVLALLVLPGPRTAIAEFFGLVPGYRIDVVPTPTPAAGTSATASPVAGAPRATPTPLDALATRATREAVTAALGFAPVVPSSLGEPEIYVARFGSQALAVYRYPQFDLWVSRQGVPGILVKTLPDGTVIETPTVRGRAGYWISGVERSMRFVDAGGADIPGSARTVGRKALIWASGNLLYRLETDSELADAVRIANSLP